MVVQEEKKEKTCSFFVSEFHLEMILLPYIDDKLKKQEKITILTEKKLRETVEILISKTNLDKKEKEKILKLNWNGDINIKENSNVIIIGSEKYIKQKNKEIEKLKTISIIDCYDFEEIKDNINTIKKEYKNILNTLGENDIKKN